MNRKQIVWVFIYRIALALLTCSIIHADEFFQSLEVAHNVVFGYGKLTWEWQPDVAIRSILYPALYVPIYWILRVTDLDTTGLLVCDLSMIPSGPEHMSERIARYMHRKYLTAQLQH
jgi:phosphatidylinositol glycan class B